MTLDEVFCKMLSRFLINSLQMPLYSLSIHIKHALQTCTHTHNKQALLLFVVLFLPSYIDNNYNYTKH